MRVEDPVRECVAEHGVEDRAPAAGSQRKEDAGGLVEQRADYFVRHVANLAAAARKRIEPEVELGREAFVMAQWAKQSAAAAAVQQMGLRFAAGSDALGALVRQRQDLSALWRERDQPALTGEEQCARLGLLVLVGGLFLLLGQVPVRWLRFFLISRQFVPGPVLILARGR